MQYSMTNSSWDFIEYSRFSMHLVAPSACQLCRYPPLHTAIKGVGKLCSRPGLCPIVSVGTVLCFGSALPDSLCIWAMPANGAVDGGGTIKNYRPGSVAPKSSTLLPLPTVAWLRMRKLSVCLPACPSSSQSVGPSVSCPSICPVVCLFALPLSFGRTFWAAAAAVVVACCMWPATIGGQLSAACRVFYLNYEMFCQQFVRWFMRSTVEGTRSWEVAKGGAGLKLSADRCINCARKSKSKSKVAPRMRQESESERRASIKCVSGRGRGRGRQPGNLAAGTGRQPARPMTSAPVTQLSITELSFRLRRLRFPLVAFVELPQIMCRQSGRG